MSNCYLLQENDMLRKDHIPVIVFFSRISDKSKFLPSIKQLSDGKGDSYDFVGCSFPDDIDVDSEKFGDGVEFWLHSGEATVLSYEEFYYYLKKACMNYLKKYPEEKDVVNRILEKVRMQYNITQ